MEIDSIKGGNHMRLSGSAADVDGSGTADATIILQYAAFIGAGGSRSLEEFLK